MNITKLKIEKIIGLLEELRNENPDKFEYCLNIMHQDKSDEAEFSTVMGVNSANTLESFDESILANMETIRMQDYYYALALQGDTNIVQCTNNRNIAHDDAVLETGHYYKIVKIKKVNDKILYNLEGKKFEDRYFDYEATWFSRITALHNLN